MKDKNFIKWLLLKIKQRKKFFAFFLIILSLYINIFATLFIKNNKLNKVIRVAFYCDTIKYGGVERVTSLLINYLSNERNFSFYLITNKGKLEGEYIIPKNIKRIFLYGKNWNLIRTIII